MELSALLDKQDLEGPVPLVRHLCLFSNAARIDDDAAVESIGRVCQWWGGGAQLLLPTRAMTDENSIWHAVLDEFGPDDVWEPGNVPTRGRGPGMWGENLLVVLSQTIEGSEKPKIDVPEVPLSDPWGISYLACFGRLPRSPDTWLSWPTDIRPDISFSELLDINWERPDQPGLEDLIQRLHRGRATPIGLSMISLGLTPAPCYTMPQEDPPILPAKRSGAMSIGPNVVVVYEPGNIEDLCLLWNLRAAHAVPIGLPIGVPNTPSLADDLRSLIRLGAARPLNLARLRVALTGFSVPFDRLTNIAAELGDPWNAIPPSDLLQAPSAPNRVSRDVATFSAGAATVTAWGASDHTNLKFLGTGGLPLHLKTRFELEQALIPPIKSLTGEAFTNQRYRHGGVEVNGGSKMSIASIHWPRGWTLLEGAARERGLRVRASTPGRAAEALIRRSGGLNATAMFADPRVLGLLTRLCENSGVSLFRRKVRGLQNLSSEDSDFLLDAAAQLQRARSDDDVDIRTVQFSVFVDQLGKQDAAAWLKWSERQGLVLRGVTLKCAGCGAGKWYQLSELGTAIRCRTCGDLLRDPFEPASLPFDYRAGEALLETFEHDAISHVLALRWLFGLLGGFEGRSRVYGVYPGVIFLEEGGAELPEVDAVLLMSDGELVVGECKRPNGVIAEKDLNNLDAVAQRVEAPWTFVATPTESDQCAAAWKAAERGGPASPRFVLTADQLFDVSGIWILGQNPFKPMAGDDKFPRRFTPSQLSFGTAAMEDADHWLFRHLDDQGRAD